MALTKDIREWLTKMGYQEPNPSEEALQILCRGAMGPIFQQIITNVKPRQEIDHIKKTILLNQLANKTTRKINQLTNPDDAEQIKLYKEKRKLDKHLQEQKSMNAELEANLQGLVRSQRSKSAKLQSLRHTIRENEKGCVLFKAKSADIEKQIQESLKLFDENSIQAERTMDSTEIEMSKLNCILSEISEAINKNDKKLSLPVQERKSLADITLSENLHISTILSSNKQPPSSTKRRNIANSTRKNIFESFSNFSTLSTASKVRNLSKISFTSFNNTSLLSDSTKISGQVDKYSEIMKDIENACWNDTRVRENVENLWKLGWENVFKLLVSIKDSHKKKINDMVISNCIKSDKISNTSKLDAVIDIDKLYCFHVQTELDKLKCEQEQRKLAEILELQFGDSVHEITVLESSEIGLQSAVQQLWKSINRLREDNSEIAETLDSVLTEIRNVQAEMMSTKLKLDTNLCLLFDCNAWIEKIQKSVYENVRDRILYPEYEVLQSNMAVTESEIFISCPILARNQSYFDRWTLSFNQPELLELIQKPFLSPENVIKYHLNEKQWLSNLVNLQKAIESSKSSLQMPSLKLSDNQVKTAEVIVKENSEKLEKSIIHFNETIAQFNTIESEINIWLEAPLNDCVFPKLTHDGKTLKEYVEMYELYYRKLT
ncbi:hypothetical protein CBL_02292 [Carabus blaptoides fortunei]